MQFWSEWQWGEEGAFPYKKFEVGDVFFSQRGNAEIVRKKPKNEQYISGMGFASCLSSLLTCKSGLAGTAVHGAWGVLQ
jgi:hypothetical protein